MAVMPPTRERRELFANTLAAWAWAQGTLVASVLVLPLLTRFMSKPEFGLWAQMLSLNTLATVADLGMSQVFLRRLASAGRSSENTLVRMAAAFYGTSGSILTAVLLGICLLPGGLLAPYAGKTQLPSVTAAVIIIAIAVNLAVQPYTLRVLARGRLDLERVFGAGPAVVGTIVTGVAAYWFGSALAVGAGYALVEVAFDVALIAVVRQSTAFKVEPTIAGRSVTVRWRDLLNESWGVLVIGVTPQLGLLIDIAVVGRIEGPAAVAVYAVCQRAAYLLPRFFSAFTESLFVTLCRAVGTDRQALAGLGATLSRVLVFSGLALACAIVTVGARALTVVFGAGYGGGEAALVVLAVAATMRAVYMPGLKRLQADAALGTLPRWFVVSVLAHIALAIILTMEWSLPGTALSVLLAALAFEAWPVARALRRHEPSMRTSSAMPLTPTGIALAGGALVLLLAWYRLTIGGWAPLFSGIAALALGALAIHQLTIYLKSSRLMIVRS
jgi:O-antigen/teichoic acid export membrane protein